MKLVNVLLGQAIRVLKISGQHGGNIYGLNLTKALEQRYGFLQGPRSLAEYDMTQGVTFLHGYFQNRIVIDRLQIFSTGLIAEGKIPTDECAAFLDDVVGWVQEAGAARVEQDANAPRIYA